MARVGLVTTDSEFLKGADAEISSLNLSLIAAGVDSDMPVWHDREIHWGEYDLLIFRSPWDYPERTTEFMEWLDQIQQLTHVLNSPELVRWNLDKRYLDELTALGVNCAPFTFCENETEVKDAIRRCRSERVIVKPTISVGSRNTGLFSYDDEHALQLASEILGLGKVVMVQPAVGAVQDGAERGLVFFNGVFSHAIRKGPILKVGGGYLGGTYTEDITAATASPNEIHLGEVLMKSIVRIGKTRGWEPEAAHPLYARVDVVTDESGLAQLLEAELFEPSIFVGTSPCAVDRFVSAVLDRLPDEKRNL